MRIITFTFCFLIAVAGHAQKRANIWYFGSNAGMDFNGGAPVALTNGQVNTYEGCAAISDSSGALQFYTDGLMVWDRTHTIMTNGGGLLGGGSSSQSAMIIPVPGNDSLYYIFCAGDGGGGFSWSMVDMNLNGGNGDVIPATKNTILLSPITEKLTAAAAQNGTDIWVVVHEWNTDAFYAYLVTPTGINPPVVSNTGLIHTPVPNQIGCMKISHNAKQIAVAVTYMSSAELFDFDNATGVISNPITFTGIEDPYGVEFSPDNSKLYFASRAPYATKALYQYDLQAGTPAAIIASLAYINQSAIGADNGTLQLGPDGKIYLTRDGSSFLEVINDPNQPAASCGYVMNGFDLSPQSSQQGLPNFITTWFSGLQVENTCWGDSTYMSVSATGGLFGVQWNFDDTASGAANLSFDFNTAHLFSTPGTFHVQLIQFFTNGVIDTTYTDIVISAAPVVDLGTDTSLCIGDTFLLNAGGGYSTYLWQDNSVDSTFSATATGLYWVKVSQSTCSIRDSIVLTFSPCNAPVVNLSSSDTVFCEKQCIDFFDLSTNNPTSWLWLFPGADSVTSTLQNPTNICYNSYGSFDVTLIACNGSGCDTLYLPGFIVEYVAPAPVLTLSNDTLYSSPGYSYQWWNSATGIIPGATGNYLVVTTGESYYVIITDSLGCAGSSGIFAITGIPGMIQDAQPLVVSPNPSSGIFTVKAYVPLNNSTVRIFNSLGEQLKLFTANLTPGNEMVISMGDAEAGLYLLVLDAEGKRYVQRISKE